jgi:hypothetical protein
VEVGRFVVAPGIGSIAVIHCAEFVAGNLTFQSTGLPVACGMLVA